MSSNAGPFGIESYLRPMIRAELYVVEKGDSCRLAYG